ncbi:MAG: ArsR family transcriptional regulator [Ruminococcus sp.]
MRWRSSTRRQILFSFSRGKNCFCQIST